MGVENEDYREIKVDHINHNIQDNRKKNLRISNNHQSSYNRGIKSNNTSGVTGIQFYKKYNKWLAEISVKGKRINLGYFENKDDAIKVRKEAEEKYFGEWSYNNSTKLN